MFFQDFFQFTSSQRRGVVVLLIILALLGVFYLINHNSVSKVNVVINPFFEEKKELTHSKDSSVYSETKLFYFNPNNLTKDKWLKLGFSNKQIQTILKYKQTIGGFKTKKDFKKCYVVSEKHYKALYPYIFFDQKKVEVNFCRAIFLLKSDTPVYHLNSKFKNLSYISDKGIYSYYINAGQPDSVIKSGFSSLDTAVFNNARVVSFECSKFNNINKKQSDTVMGFSVKNLNQASVSDFQLIRGVGDVLSKRIIRYKKRLGGFINVNQLDEVYGLENNVLKELKTNFFISDSLSVNKLNVNLISVDSLKKHPYIDWNLANSIVEFRNQHGFYESIEKIKLTHLVNDEIYRKIAPYLTTR